MKIRGRIVSFLLLLVLFAGTIGTTINPILKDVKLGLDLQGGFEVLYQVKPLKDDGQEITESMVVDTAGALSKRIDVLGVSEPNIQVESNNRIRVQLAGVEDQESARALLSTQANLTFRDADDNLILDGSDLKEGKAKGDFGESGAPVVTLEMKDPNKFGEVTAEISKKLPPENVLVIWLDFEEGVDSYKEEIMKPDPAFVSAPRVTKPIHSSNVEISGSFTVEETKELAGILNAGALPVQLEEIYSTSVGAQFGEQALNKTILAGIIGIALVFIFMLVYYRLPGLIAVITLSVYIYLILLVFTKINGVLTLPGIAALMLGVGMAVDANILTYERIREELRVGKSIKSSFDAGAKSSFTAILDANITTLLAAVVLFIFGTSSVKGFAMMLMISILVSFITAVWGSRLLLGLLVKSEILDGKPGLFGISKKRIHPAYEEVDTLDLTTKFDRFDFVESRKRFFALSAILLISGAIVLGIFKLNLGIDFSSGTRVEVLSDQALSADKIEEYVDSIGYPTSDIVISGEDKNIGVIRYADEFSQDEINTLKSNLAEHYGAEPNVSTVSPTVGKELVKNAIYALAFAAIGIIIYVAFRFEWRMGLASIIGLLHDAFFMVAVFSILRLEVDITFVAAVLTIIGYSINDTIVTFDRIRENMNRRKEIKDAKELADIVNKSLRQTLTRSVNTVLTVIFVVVALMLLGAESIQNFSIALLIGLIAGTYSSIFISAQIWYNLKKREMQEKGSIKIDKEKKQWGSDEPVV
ncbi:protein translocase subunit SecDF [Sporosarcina pasteurii]|uniref:Multifunctional fusion protein n=1 Tax=Sporosarcina pasteurii TaxID=1474 RepID=A0A380BUX1_SPOPA|nr:protein translocase subunit SecDF [Sporosarcina pasteurii]MDS9471299.1 protein translocase subunit SecDF [Sporosarcina pasteurii]QBQ05071.1 protein translocase subunit SecDF [Sporosarcina pasteurii]SUJ07003.1 bifunctional preprotein translocase subunit SecD/SecF [Sporosarcina pasteurii]